MDPNQPNQNNQNLQQQPAQSNNNYDFIMNPQNSGNRSPFMAPGSTKMRIIVFASGIIVLIILMLVFFSFLNSAGSQQRENLLRAAQTQTEIIRVIDSANTNISDQELLDKTTTLRAVMITTQQDTLAALSSRGQNASPKELGRGENPQYDADLETASAQARHDEELNEILLSLIEQHTAQLQAVFENGNTAEQELATEAFNQVDLIFKLSESETEDTQQEQTSQ